jgi:hypothetical protein
MKREPKALALAYKRARAKSLKIKELGIHPAMTEAETDALIVKLAKQKATESEKEGADYKDFVKGQRWYVEDLIAYSAKSTTERLDFEYEVAFPETATEEEMIAKLEELV